MQTNSSVEIFALSVEQNELAQVLLEPSAELVRDRPRPEDKRQLDYDEEFDFHTLYFDAFFMPDSSHVRLVGPPLFNLTEYVENGSVKVVVHGSGGAPAVVQYEVSHLQKTQRLDIVFDQELHSATLELDFGTLGIFRIRVNEAGVDIFEGCRVAFTMFKYEPMVWLMDWAEFNVKYHGADALLIYHNNSVHYDTSEITQALSDIEGLKYLVVVHWPFKYGPSADGTGFWDSTFCQLGMFEQARWRYLAQAKSVLNGDIDELVLTEEHKSLFEMAEGTAEGYLKFGGVAVAGEEGVSVASEDRRHMDFVRMGDTPFGGLVGAKWVVVPSRCPEGNQWLIHGIKQLAWDEARSEMATLCHFMGISTNWKPGANRSWINPRRFEQLEQAYSQIGW